MLNHVASLLCSISLMVMLATITVEAKNTTTIIKENKYVLDTDINVGYEKMSIAEQLEDASRIQCSLKCNMIEGCNHVAVDEVEQRCKLLKEIVSLNGKNPEDEREDGEKIYSLVGKL